MGRYDTEAGRVPRLHGVSLKLEVPRFASWQDGTRVACVGYDIFNKWRKVSTAMESVLDAKSAVVAQVSTPLVVDLSFQVERLFLVRDITRCDNESKANPKKKCVPRKEHSVVQNDTSVTQK